MMDRPEDIPQWAWDEACHIWAYQLGFANDRFAGRKVIARALMKARDKALTEITALLSPVETSLEAAIYEYERLGILPGAVEIMQGQLALIRQHSQKGEK